MVTAKEITQKYLYGNISTPGNKVDDALMARDTYGTNQSTNPHDGHVLFTGSQTDVAQAIENAKSAVE